MTKRRSWKFSNGGAAIFVGLLIGPLVLRLLWIVTQQGIASLSGLAGLVCALVLGGIGWLIALRPLITERLWTSTQGWYEALFAMSTVYAVYASWIFATGTSPGRTGGQPIPRDDGLYCVALAAVFFVGGAGAYYLNKVKTK